MAATLPPGDALFDEAACGLLLTAADGTLLRVNRTFREWTGHDEQALLGKRTLQSLLSVGGRIFHQTHWAPLLQMQGSVAEVKLDFLHADGRRIPCVINARLRPWEGEVLHAVAVFVAEDRHKYELEFVRARRETEVLLKESQASARALSEAEAVLKSAMEQLQDQASEAKARATFAEQMMGIVGHDLRNPLSTLNVMAQLIRMAADFPPEARARTADRMQRAVDAGNRLIADMLDFTAAKIGKGLTVTAKESDLHATVAQSVADLAAGHPPGRLTHVAHGQALCRVDPDRLVQLLGNLVANALTYGSPDHPVDIVSRVEPGRASVSVANRGAPIPADLLPRLFEPMTRGNVPDQGHRSVGLGLFIVSEIARAHGGAVEVASTAEAGTCFTISLPQA